MNFIPVLFDLRKERQVVNCVKLTHALDSKETRMNSLQSSVAIHFFFRFSNVQVSLRFCSRYEFVRQEMFPRVDLYMLINSRNVSSGRPIWADKFKKCFLG
jgi:hypothetical protein